MKFYKNILKFFFVLFFLVFFTETSFAAIQLNKSQYYPDETVSFVTSGGPWNVYDITGTRNYGGDEEYGSADVSQLSLDKVAGHQYSVIELTDISVCESGGLTYEQCKAVPEFVGEFKFSVIARPLTSISVGGGGGPTAYRPEISIYSPLDGKIYGKNVEIIYEATDKNDSLGQPNLGLISLPVSISYSASSDARQRTQIATNLPDKGVFKWNTGELPEGDTYNVIISAIDKVGEIGESISGNFSLDHTFPVFAVKTDPTITRGEDVRILVESSKELAVPPIVKVTQNEFNSFDVLMSGSGNKFEGLYKVVGGYDGPAKIEVSGRDQAGNESYLVVSGGQFSVGILPPPKPIIAYPLDRDIVPTGITEIKGKARKDTEVILSLNGGEKFSKTPDSNGEFVFSGLRLRPEFNFGVNVISIYSKDAAGNISETADLNLKYNISPEIFLESPVKGQTLGTTTKISVNATDKNKDRLNFKYEVSKDNGLTWSPLELSTNKRIYVWDTTVFEDGDYSIKVTVSDGTTEKVATVSGLIIKNLLPTFSFDGGTRTVTNKKELMIGGTVASSLKMSVRSKILSVEYSQDNGKTWNDANIISGANTSDVKFNISVNFAEEKTHQFLFRSKDDRGIYGRGNKTVVVIFEPPIIPTVTSVKRGAILDDSFDENKFEAGIQITISGTSKPNTNVSAIVDGAVFSGKTDILGNFSVAGVTIRKHGNNTVDIYAEDEAGNKSGTNTLSFVYNNPPTLKFLNPRQGRGLNHKTNIEFNVIDKDGDEIKKVTLSFKKPGETSFRTLDVNSPENKFELDVTSFKEGGGYELKLESTDGLSSSSKTIEFFVDNIEPKIFLNDIPNRNFKKDFKFEATGYAEDNLSGIEFVEYSLDRTHWFKALITKGFLAKVASFKIRHPFTLDDGEYQINFRSVDAAGNYSDIWTESIIVDTMPPRIGSYDISYHGISVYPDENGFIILPDKIIKIRASFEIDTKEAYFVIGNEKIKLSKNSSGVWEGEFKTKDTGLFDIRFGAKDEFGNGIENKKIGVINTSKEGTIKVLSSDGEMTNEVISGADVGVYIFSEDRQRFERWPGEYYEIENPAKSDKSGNYSLFLPAGKYQLHIQKTGFVKLKTNEFVLSSGKFINFDFGLKKREGVRGYIENVLEKIMIF